jgi:hypothetical protein
MIDLNYHKGQKCIYGPTFCQEGFCSACNIQLTLSPESIFTPNTRNKRTSIQERNRDLSGIRALQPI